MENENFGNTNEDLSGWNEAFGFDSTENTGSDSPEPSATTDCDSNKPSVADTSAEDSKGEAKSTEPIEEKKQIKDNPNRVRKEINNRNAQRRIAKREAKRNELLKQQQALAGRGNDDFEKRLVDERIADLDAEQREQEYEDFTQTAYDVFGEGAGKYLADVQRVAPYVNENHPEVVEFWQADPVVGNVFLKAWMRRMDNPVTRNQYLRATPTQRSRICDSLYTSLYNKLNETSSEPSQQKVTEAQPAKPVYCPMSTGGHNSSASSDGDDWASAFAREDAKRKVKRF